MTIRSDDYRGEMTDFNSCGVSKLIDQFVQLRKLRQISQDEVDNLMGNSDRQISKWECGFRTPRTFNLICWAEALDAELKLISNDEPLVPVDMHIGSLLIDDFVSIH